MLTVIPTATVYHGGKTTGLNDEENLQQLIRDFQEVDLNRTPSSKPLPSDLFRTIDGEVPKASIKGQFLVQIVSIEPLNDLQGSNSLLLIISDGLNKMHAQTDGSIAHLHLNVKPGSKLLLTDTIPIQDGYLQLNSSNTEFHFGSNTYARPRSSYRHRSRVPYENRRNPRYDNEDFVKRPPPKTTLIDFMPQLKLSVDGENEKGKERYGKRRSNGDASQATVAMNDPSLSSTMIKDQMVHENDGIDPTTENDDDAAAHGMFRERRNPLPPRLQRVQEERSRRNPGRYPDEYLYTGTEYHPTYSADPSTYLHDGSNGMSYMTNHSSTNNSFVAHPNLIAPINGFYPANPSGFALQPMIASPYPITNYLPPSLMTNGNLLPTGSTTIDEQETKKSSQQTFDENSEPTNEQKSDEKRRETNSTSRPRWKIGDVCFARWSEDGEFYYAMVLDIQPPFCQIVFTEYNTYDKVHFNDMKVVPRDQLYYQYYPSAEQQLYPGNSYLPTGMDGCLVMPRAPPFPFTSDGTVYICPTSINTFARPTRVTQVRRPDQVNSTLNSSSPPSKESDQSSTMDSSNQRTEDDEGEIDLSKSLAKVKPSPIVDSPLALVTADDLHPPNQ